MAGRVSTLGNHKNVTNDMLSVQRTIADKHKQISTGKQASTFAEVSEGGDTERMVIFGSDLAKTNSYVRNNSIVVSRLESGEAAVGAMHELNIHFRSLLTIRRSAVKKEDLPLETQARGMLDSLRSLMNTQFAGRYLFSGAKTDTPPVGDLQVTNVDSKTDLPTASYYQGDATILSIQGDDSLNLSYGITAEHPGFQNLIAAFHKGIEAHNIGKEELFEKAFDFLAVALDELNAARTSMSNNRIILENVNTKHETIILAFRKSISEIIDTDIPSASIEIAANETILQASFMTFGRLSNLRLVDYLK